MAQLYKMSLTKVPSKLVGPILDLLEQDGVALAIVEPMEREEYHPLSHRKRTLAPGLTRTHRSRTDKKTSEQYIIEALDAGKKLTFAQLQAILVDKGFAPTTLNPSLSRLVRSHVVDRECFPGDRQRDKFWLKLKGES